MLLKSLETKLVSSPKRWSPSREFGLRLSLDPAGECSSQGQSSGLVFNSGAKISVSASLETEILVFVSVLFSLSNV